MTSRSPRSDGAISCPGSKVGNARYTVRDWVKGTTRFRVRKDAPLPEDGKKVGIVFRLK